MLIYSRVIVFCVSNRDNMLEGNSMYFRACLKSRSCVIVVFFGCICESVIAQEQEYVPTVKESLESLVRATASKDPKQLQNVVSGLLDKREVKESDATGELKDMWRDINASSNDGVHVNDFARVILCRNPNKGQAALIIYLNKIKKTISEQSDSSWTFEEGQSVLVPLRALIAIHECQVVKKDVVPDLPVIMTMKSGRVAARTTVVGHINRRNDELSGLATEQNRKKERVIVVTRGNYYSIAKAVAKSITHNTTVKKK
jgi:hypothetical protein